MSIIKIEADWKKIMEDGSDTALFHMGSAIASIDKKFGEGYAKEHPELVAAFMNTASNVEAGYVIGKCLLQIGDRLDDLVAATLNFDK